MTGSSLEVELDIGQVRTVSMPRHTQVLSYRFRKRREWSPYGRTFALRGEPARLVLFTLRPNTGGEPAMCPR